MRVLVTGGAGFIGSAFIRRLASGSRWEPFAVDRLTYAADMERLEGREVPFFKADVADAGAMAAVFEEVKPGFLVHFAAETHVDRSIVSPGDFISTNIVGTATLLSLARAHGLEKFVLISTDEVYGHLPADRALRFREGDPLLPNSPYAASKASADLLARAYRRTYDLPVVTVRPSNNYGPWQYPEKLIPLTIARILRGEKIPVYGKGENIRTWLFVDECAEAIEMVLDRGEPGEVYNVGSAEEVSNIEVVRTLISLLGAGEGLIEFVADRPGHDFRYAVDTGKITSALGWHARIDFFEGIRKTVAWYRDHKGWLEKKRELVDSFVTGLCAEFEKMRGEKAR
ncbi:MAG: dTDP-glucose 4,6-dehydratase [Candidatus Eremiobacteraeota bacterium]|nr:dTDP-glucose 4,6-dehydratase [Candidatus Eremiobacteraeota bacterium]